MKLASDIANKIQTGFRTDKVYLCDYILAPTGVIKVKPFMSNEHECQWCGNSDHLCPVADPTISESRAWLCSNQLCDANNKKFKLQATTTPVTQKRAQEWAKFCEINDIGNTHEDVKFESIEQDDKKISYMVKFVNTPRGIILMRGEPGSGKTYCAMAMCELFTRGNVSALFVTQKQMSMKFLNTFDGNSSYVEMLKRVSLLVVDDFGTAEMSKDFLASFMDIINTRMQWKDRGTVITTNLDAEALAKFCGDALTDRLNTGVQFKFKDQSRRKPTIL